MRTLYPEIQPFQSQQLKVDEIHTLYLEQSGNIKGIPVIFLHGGPGSGSNANHRRYFDPEKYHIINFDQRGCNRSEPQGCTNNNTTQLLIDDIEAIREALKLEAWLIFGGSWGATLGLLYAQCHPQRVTGLILRGSFLARRRDLEWFVANGANRIFPEYWNEFVNHVPEDERIDIVDAYYKRLHGDNTLEQRQAAVAWSKWAGRLVTYMLKEIDADNYQVADTQETVNEVQIETHYAKYKYFIAENQILDSIAALPEVPTTIIHGRKDLTCTVEASWSLHHAIPKSELHIVKEGGHLAGEPPMVDALVSATDAMVTRLK